MENPDQWVVKIPWRGVPKARPRVTAKGTFMPARYRDWKRDVSEYLRLQGLPHIDGPVAIELDFGSESVVVRCRRLLGTWERWKYVRGDIDNLIGGVLDAMQDAEVIDDDRQVFIVKADIGRNTSYE